MDTVDLTQIAELQKHSKRYNSNFRYYASGQTTTGGWGFSSPALDADALAIGGSLVALPSTPQITVVQNCDGTVTFLRMLLVLYCGVPMIPLQVLLFLLLELIRFHKPLMVLLVT